jgi:hypothetical protein
MWISLVAIAGWIFTAMAWWRSSKTVEHNDKAAKEGGAKIGSNLAHHREAIKRACIANDPGKTRQALITWAQSMWPHRHFSSLVEVSQQPGMGRAKTHFDKLDAAIYSSSPGNWDGDAFWDNCAPLLKSPPIEEKGTRSLLPELYPQP